MNNNCHACGGSTLHSTYVEGEPLPHHPGCVYNSEVVTCGDCEESWYSDHTDDNVLEALALWEKEHPNLAQYMTLLQELGYTPSVEKFPTRGAEDILYDMDEILNDLLTETEKGWLTTYINWWNGEAK